ncbi:MAG: low molecular weight phosphatase family protein [Capsulimonadales bacterium]|nr:low molecular weight phosphatase family protein [Capsulimonadales bacterium]
MTTVLFVGHRNASRSQMAEAFLNHFAQERGLPLRAESAGISIGTALNLFAEDIMREVSIPLIGQHPKPLTAAMSERADRIILMGQGVCPPELPGSRHAPVTCWDLEEIGGQPMEEIRDIRNEIRWRVERMVEELVGASPTSEESASPLTPSEALSRQCHSLSDGQRQRRQALLRNLLPRLQGIEEISEGLLLRFPAATVIGSEVMEWVMIERSACPFLTVVLALEAGAEVITVRMTGPDGTREMLSPLFAGRNPSGD